MKSISKLAAVAALSCGAAMGADLEVFHADSLAGPMREMKKAFESAHPSTTVNLTSGVSKELAARIVKGDRCDVFASSSPAVIDDDMIGKTVAGSGKPAATGYVIFSANEMVVITGKGNPKGIRAMADLAQPSLRFVRVTGEKDLGTGRTIEFVKRATSAEGKPDLAQRIIDGAPADPAKPNSVPETVKAVREGRADAGIVYYSAAIAARNDIEIVRFPAAVNMSEAIRNAAVIPGTAKSEADARAFVQLLVSEQGQEILKATGQPPITPPIRKGDI